MTINKNRPPLTLSRFRNVNARARIKAWWRGLSDESRFCLGMCLWYPFLVAMATGVYVMYCLMLAKHSG